MLCFSISACFLNLTEFHTFRRISSHTNPQHSILLLFWPCRTVLPSISTIFHPISSCTASIPINGASKPPLLPSRPISSRQLLDVADNLERAVSSGGQEGQGAGGNSAHEQLLLGVKMTSEEVGTAVGIHTPVYDFCLY